MHPTKDEFLVALTKIEQFAPAPRTLARILQLLQDHDSELQTIAELINVDTALAVDVLRCANSAYYSRGNRVSAVDEAVQVIGFHETLRLVSLLAIQQLAHRDLPAYTISADDFWSESLYNGLYFEALVRRCTHLPPEEGYTAGLLRFIGRLAINQTIEELGDDARWDRHSPVAQWERDQVGLTQAQAGAVLLRKWSFPNSIVTAVASQDDPASSCSNSREPLASAMNFAVASLPDWLGFEAVDCMRDAACVFPEDHPFALEHTITSADTSELRAEAYRRFVAIRDELFGAY